MLQMLEIFTPQRDSFQGVYGGFSTSLDLAGLRASERESRNF